MKTRNLKPSKIVSLALIAVLAGSLPAVSMAHEYNRPVDRVFINLLPLFDLHDGYGRHHHRKEIRYIPQRHDHHYQQHNHSYQHQPHRVVRSYDGYSDNKIIYKRFK